MDSDMLVISPIDHALYDFSNASFAAGTFATNYLASMQRS